MKHWDLFVLPSLWEGFPTVVMEAMLSKIPIIATNIPGTNELVKDYETGILVPIKDTKELAKNIVKLYKDKLLRNSLVENAARQVINYSMESIAQDYYNLFVKNLN
jgi:glycosyltransferase involved in cell wall biosynthesis